MPDPKKPVPHDPAPDAVPRDDVRVTGSLVRCPFCHTDLAADSAGWVACKSCLARHHEACWKESGRCASCGKDAFVSEPQALPRSRAGLYTLLVVAIAAVSVVLGGLRGGSAKAPAAAPAFAPTPAQPPKPPANEEVLREFARDFTAEVETTGLDLAPHPGLSIPIEALTALPRVHTVETSRVANVDMLWIGLLPGAHLDLTEIEKALGPVKLDRAAKLVGNYDFTFADPHGKLADHLHEVFGRRAHVSTRTVEEETFVWGYLEPDNGVSLESLAKSPGDECEWRETRLTGHTSTITYELGIQGNPAGGEKQVLEIRGVQSYSEHPSFAPGTEGVDHSFKFKVAGPQHSAGEPLDQLEKALAPARVSRTTPLWGEFNITVKGKNEINRVQDRLGVRALEMTWKGPYRGGVGFVHFLVRKSKPVTLGQIEEVFRPYGGESLELMGDAGEP